MNYEKYQLIQNMNHSLIFLIHLIKRKKNVILKTTSTRFQTNET